MARYSFSGSMPPKFEHKLRRRKQRFGKIATTVLLDKDFLSEVSCLQVKASHYIEGNVSKFHFLVNNSN